MKKLIFTLGILMICSTMFGQMLRIENSADRTVYKIEINIASATVADTTFMQEISPNCTLQIEYDTLTLTGTGAVITLKTKASRDKAWVDYEHRDLPLTITNDGYALYTDAWKGGFFGCNVDFGSATAGYLTFYLIIKRNN